MKENKVEVFGFCGVEEDEKMISGCKQIGEFKGM